MISNQNQLFLSPKLTPAPSGPSPKTPPTAASDKEKAVRRKKTGEPPADRELLVCYCGHQFPYPAGTKLEAIRSELQRKHFPELSKERTAFFWEQPKEQKKDDNQPTLINVSEPLVIVPYISAGKKGLGDSQPFKLFWSLEEALAANQPTAVVAASDGQLYALRKTDAGIFPHRMTSMSEIPQLDNPPVASLEIALDGSFYLLRNKEKGVSHYRLTGVAGLPEIREQPQLAHGKIPYKILAAFVEVAREALPNEIAAWVVWDKELGHHRLLVLDQEAEPTSTIYKGVPLDPERHTHVADIHSHATMPAFFSCTDDEDECRTGLYVVIGDVDWQFVGLRTRYSSGGYFYDVRPSCIFDLEGQMVLPADKENIRVAVLY